MHGDAVHRRRHAVLAHPVADVAAGRIAGGRMSSWSLALVLFDGVRSAEPPTSSGTTGIRLSSTVPEAWRVAILAFGLPRLVA